MPGRQSAIHPGEALAAEFLEPLGMRQYHLTKSIDVPSRRIYEIVQGKQAISTNMDPARDITLVEHTPIDYLDFASPEDGLGSKIGLDATTKWPPETKRAWGRKIRMSQEVIDKIDKLWPELGLPGDGKAIWK